MTKKGAQAAIYCRISRANDDDTTKTDDQERICRELADRLHWDVAQVYTDHSRSAWARNRKRPGWDAMLADVESGAITAIIVYHGDRLVRQPFDLEKLLNLAEGKGVRLASPTGTRDLGNADDRFVLRIEAAVGCRSSDDTSRRAIDGYERMRRSGMVRAGGRGGRAFGFATDGVTHYPHETELIREAAQRILAGEGAKAIAADWWERGVRSVTGVPLDHGTLRKMLQRPRLAGLMPDGVARAAWEPVLDVATWQMTCAVLSARAAGFGYATNARKYLLSGIAVCGVCETPLQVNPSKGRSGSYVVGYACRASGCKKVYRSQPLLDAFVSARTVRRLGHPDSPRPQLPALPGVAAELAALTERRAEAAAVIASLAEHPGQRIDVLARALASFDEKIADLAARLAASNGAALIAMHAGISREEFSSLPLATCRELVQGTWHVTVMPASRRGPGFEPRDVILSPASDQPVY